ncbi:MAG: sodium:solute symporter [Verrucomicrobiota bacterium]|jgi:Na+/proline symporter
MNPLDYLVLFGTMLGIAAYGIWRTRGQRGLSAYLKGSGTTGWVTIGLSVMATQASAITFISTPGQGYEDGLGFVQNYFGMPLALILIAAVFLPMFRRWNVYTAYEFLGRRFDTKTRLLGAGLFLLQRGLGAGITIYAPAIILSTVFGWPLELTIILSGLLVIIYTVTGGNEAVSVTQKYQILVIFGGMAAALAVLLERLSGHLALTDALHLAGTFHKLNAVDFSPDPRRRYTFWSGLFGGLCLSLSYFGTDQSQVQRYISGASLRESRLGLMFNAVCKIPMQFLILLLGVLMFVFYQFEPPPVFFNQSSWKAAAERDGGKFHAVEQKFAAACAQQEQSIRDWLDARRRHDPAAETAARARTLAAQRQSEAVRAEARAALRQADVHAQTNDGDYVFITFILAELPHGAIGLLVAAFFAAALSSKAAELSALGSTTAVDFYRHLLRREAGDAHYVKASRWFTAMWGLVALGFALFAHLQENLIQAVNIVGSVFYGVVLGLFLVAFFVRWVGGTAVFFAAVLAQELVFCLYFSLNISYLWYNLIGCAACVLFSVLIQALDFKKKEGSGLL